jgi:hypothetical protein
MKIRVFFWILRSTKSEHALCYTALVVCPLLNIRPYGPALYIKPYGNHEVQQVHDTSTGFLKPHNPYRDENPNPTVPNYITLGPIRLNKRKHRG